MSQYAKVGSLKTSKLNSSKWVTVIPIALHFCLLFLAEDCTDSWFNLTHHNEFRHLLIGWVTTLFISRLACCHGHRCNIFKAASDQHTCPFSLWPTLPYCPSKLTCFCHCPGKTLMPATLKDLDWPQSQVRTLCLSSLSTSNYALLGAPSVVQTSKNQWGLWLDCKESGSIFPNPMLPISLLNFPYADVEVHSIQWSVPFSQVFSCKSLSEQNCKASLTFLLYHHSVYFF